MITLVLDRPWLRASLPPGMRALSHAPVGAGYVMARAVLWREVRNTDLTPGFDAERWFAAEVADQAQRQPGAGVTVGMMTSRDVGSFCHHRAEVAGIAAEAVVTLGLSNAEAVGARLPWHAADGCAGFGTVNILVVLDQPLTRAAQLEALTIAVQARTAAIMDLGLRLPSGIATGTGTDCMVLACPVAPRAGQARYAGLHTPAGEAVGAATRRAVAEAGAVWLAWLAAKRAQG